jgi:hypothetical protein
MVVSRVGTKRETWLIRVGLLQTGLPAMTVTYLETLNREQRRAVEHGVQTKYGAPGSHGETEDSLAVSGTERNSGFFPIELNQVAQLQREADERGGPRLAWCAIAQT